MISLSSPSRKDAKEPPSTPLEKLLLDAGPMRNDGSDKFFGMENVCAENGFLFDAKGCHAHTLLG